MIAHHEVAIIRDNRLGIGAGIAVHVWHIVFGEGLAIYPDLAMIDRRRPLARAITRLM